jgi:hypothetical protein
MECRERKAGFVLEKGAAVGWNNRCEGGVFDLTEKEYKSIMDYVTRALDVVSGAEAKTCVRLIGAEARRLRNVSKRPQKRGRVNLADIPVGTFEEKL